MFLVGAILLSSHPASARRLKDIVEDTVRLHLSQEQLGVMIEHSKKEFPVEACGILAGKDGKVQKIYQMTNTKQNATEYLMETEELYKVLTEIESLGLDILGIYHSHTKGEAYPSPKDVMMAYFPDTAYVIISLKNINNPIVRLFRIVDGKITKGEIQQISN